MLNTRYETISEDPIQNEHTEEKLPEKLPRFAKSWKPYEPIHSRIQSVHIPPQDLSSQALRNREKEKFSRLPDQSWQPKGQLHPNVYALQHWSKIEDSARIVP